MNPAPFQLFGVQHLAALGVVVALVVLVGRFGKQTLQQVRPQARAVLALLLLGYALVAYVRFYQLGYPWTAYLPLHLCDLLLFPAFIALWRPRRFPFELTYYFGLAGALPAMFTPDLRSGFPSFAFFHFFWGHGALILALTWLIAVEGLRPGPRAVLRMLLAGNLYVIVVGLIDLVFGLNYGYLCRPPAGRTLLSYLGSWPWYILVVELLAGVLFCLLDLPWRLRSKRMFASQVVAPGE